MAFGIVALAAILMPATPAQAGAPTLTNVSSVSSGSFFACAVRQSGQAGCWGNNTYGGLGDGTDVDTLAPVQVREVSNNPMVNAASISTGLNHACVLRTTAQVACWGWNYHGQIGDGTNVDRWNPVTLAVFGNSPRTVSASHGNTCVLTFVDEVYCWGDNFNGQVGDGTYIARNSPPASPVLTDVKAIDAGADSVCAIKNSGQVYCWGDNDYGQLGDGTSVDRLTPTPVTGLTDAKAISISSDMGCAIKVSGQAVCWGKNTLGSLGDNTTTDHLTPMPVSNLNDATAISAGPTHVCAIKSSGQVVCWGNNAFGMVGDGTTTARLTPVPAIGLDHVKAISVSNDTSYSCAVRTDGRLFCWGVNYYGNLGDGTSVERHTPTPVLRGDMSGINYEVKVARDGSGSGTVTSSPERLDCGTACRAEFDDGSPVMLAATPAPGSVFAGWSGPCSGTGSCVIELSAATTVTATFKSGGTNPTEHTLLVQKSNDGSGTVTSNPNGINCGTACQAQFNTGVKVTLSASPDPPSVFTGWNGACVGKGSCQVKMDETRTVWASFSQVDPAHPPLVVFTNGSGGGSVKSNPGGIECNGVDKTCQATFDKNSLITLTATPQRGSTFKGWGGDCSGLLVTCKVKMDQVRSVWAKFAETKVPPPPPPTAKAKFGKLKITPKRRAVKRGKVVRFRAKVKNVGAVRATGVKICLKAPKRKVKMMKRAVMKKTGGKPKRRKVKKRCVKVGTLPAGKAVSVKFRVKLKKKAKQGKRVRLKFRAVGKRVHKRTAAAKIKVK